MWGWNVNGQLGLPLYEEIETTIDGNDTRRERRKKASVFPLPAILDLHRGDDEGNDRLDDQYSPLEVFAGTRHTIVRTVDGTVLGSGWNKYRQLGDCKTEQDAFVKLKTIDANLNYDYRIVCGEWSSMYFTVK